MPVPLDYDSSPKPNRGIPGLSQLGLLTTASVCASLLLPLLGGDRESGEWSGVITLMLGILLTCHTLANRLIFRTEIPTWITLLVCLIWAAFAFFAIGFVLFMH